MAFIWAAVVASIAFLLHYTQLPWLLFPVLWFAAFLASGGRSFPRIFFRTALRDLRFFWALFGIQARAKKNLKNGVTVAGVFRQTLAKHPQKAAFIFEDKTWTFQDVEDYSNQIANYFKSQGYKKGEVVALFLESCPEFVCLWLGLSKLGVITALVNTNLRLKSLKHCITVAESKAVIYGSNLAVAVKDISDNLPKDIQLYYFGHDPNANIIQAMNLITELERCSMAVPVTDHKKSPNDALVYIYTSGTTGYPKPVVFTHIRYFQVVNIPYMVGHSYNSDDIIYNTLPLYHTSGGAIGVGACLVNGNTVALRRKFSASRFWDDCIKTKATIALYIGELCRFLLAQPYCPSEMQHSLRVLIGNGLKPQIWSEFQSRFGIRYIGEFYGSTEGNASFFNMDNTPGTCGFVSRIAPNRMFAKFIKANPITGDIIRGNNGLAILAKPGEPGLAVGKIKGNPYARYLSQEETSKKITCDVFEKGDSYYVTGDLLITDEYGYVRFHDRIGDTFRWRGENVSTAEVEATISNILGLRDVVVYGVKVPGTEGRAGMAAIVDEDSKGIDLIALLQQLKEHLPVYARPIFLRIVDSVTVTGTFKLQKNKLREEGYDMNAVKDKLLYFDVKAGKYLELDEEKYAKFTAGEMNI
ncbi:PREDICTED: long-chain fatty acid transport protein 4-like isoform X2 [Acropora digitifera]|uniref:long-chain fatty acid transport protein 4-like isoform X2 n=1 Tax=Acropora digitifera TaxID=70779 RepID=UPI00077ABDCB|nr:PREDICTED: long-chain fatty acid transport protein 4-like isoform X2 [Acropora digitifera]